MCSVCEADYYAFRHNEEAGRCLSNSVTLLQAGFTATAVGIYRFAFSGELAPDLRSGTVTVPATAQLFLTGTGTEEVGASFVIDGGSLTLSDLQCEIGTLATLEGSRLSIYGLTMAVAKNQLVISNGAAGTYTAAIAGSLGISTDLVIEAGQQVSIVGDGESEAAVSLSINHCCWCICPSV